MRAVSLLSLAAAVATAQSTVSDWGQCGGMGWSGPTKCGNPNYTCVTYNPYYSQCVPGTASSSTTTTPTPTPVPSSTRSTVLTPSTTFATVTTPGGGNSSPTPTTLESGWYWIRAVATPYYRSYLQAAPTATPNAVAVLSKNSGAAQFQASSGQLVMNRFGSPSLYLQVENPTDRTQRKLRTWFEATPNTHGKFDFQGDTLVWTVADIARPNAAAWLVCEGSELFVNTGAFLYNTPAGCYDHTIHSYGGSKADV